MLDGADLTQQVRALVDRAEIGDLLSEYAAAMDGQHPERFVDLFTPDAVIEHGKGAHEGRDEIVRSVGAASLGHFTSHHMMTNHRIVVRGDEGRATIYFHSVHLDDPAQADQHEDHGGWYLVNAARTPDGWRISRLKQVSVWSAENRKPTGPLSPAIVPELRHHLDFG